ncbi:MAG: hypothetical protein ACE5Z5_15025 [Candidatus Bathyarchaeia archaeon]
MTRGKGNRVENLFSRLKDPTRSFNHNINSTTLERGLECWSRFLKGF